MWNEANLILQLFFTLLYFTLTDKSFMGLHMRFFFLKYLWLCQICVDFFKKYHVFQTN